MHRKAPFSLCHHERSRGICSSFVQPASNLNGKHPPPCHPDRSEAQWSDLRFTHPASDVGKGTTLPLVIPIGAQGLVEVTCCSRRPYHEPMRSTIFLYDRRNPVQQGRLVSELQIVRESQPTTLLRIPGPSVPRCPGITSPLRLHHPSKN